MCVYVAGHVDVSNSVCVHMCGKCKGGDVCIKLSDMSSRGYRMDTNLVPIIGKHILTLTKSNECIDVTSCVTRNLLHF